MCEWRLTIIQKQNSMLEENSPLVLCNGGMTLFFSTFGGIPEKWTQPLIGLKDVNLFYLIP